MWWIWNRRKGFGEKKWIRFDEVVYEMKRPSVPKKYERQLGLFQVYIFGSSGRGNGGGVDKALSAQQKGEVSNVEMGRF